MVNSIKHTKKFTAICRMGVDMKPKIKAKQTTKNGLPSYDYVYGYDGIESTSDLIAAQFIRDIAKESESSSLKEIIEGDGPSFSMGDAILLGFMFTFIGFVLGFLVVAL